jgi:hypothetical protein
LKGKKKKQRHHSEKWPLVALLLVLAAIFLAYVVAPAWYTSSQEDRACEQYRQVHYIRIRITNLHSYPVRVVWNYSWTSIGWNEQYDVKPKQTVTVYTYYAFHVGDNVTLIFHAYMLSDEGLTTGTTNDAIADYNVMRDGRLVADNDYFPYLLKYAKTTSTLELDCRSNQIFDVPHIYLGLG